MTTATSPESSLAADGTTPRADWRDPDLTPTQIADGFMEAYSQELLGAGVVLTGRPENVSGSFLDQGAEVLDRISTRSGVRCLAVFSDPIETNTDTDADAEFRAHTLREAEQEIVVRLSAEAYPLVVSFVEVWGIADSPNVYAVGDAGVSDRLLQSAEWNRAGHRWPRDLGDDFRMNPQPAVELATLWGVAWLDGRAGPDPDDYVDSGLERGSITRYLETHEPGGADAIVAASVLGLGGIGLIWIVRRRLLAEEAAVAAGAGDEPTRVPPRVVERLPELLATRAPQVDAQEARTEEGLDWAAVLEEVGRDWEVLVERIRARLPSDALPSGADSPESPALRLVDDSLPVVEVAALVVLHEEMVARDRQWRAHTRRGQDCDASLLPRFCAFNPFHGQTTLTATVRGGSDSVDVPACMVCRDALGREEATAALMVRAEGHSRWYADVDDAYGRSMFGALTPLGPVVRELPRSGAPGHRRRGNSFLRGCLPLLVMPVLILLLAAVLGAGVSILLAGLEPARFFTETELAEQAAESGPMVLGYPVLNALRGAGIGAIGALGICWIVTMILVAVRSDKKKPGPKSDDPGAVGHDPNRPSELENPAVQKNITRLLGDGG